MRIVLHKKTSATKRALARATFALLAALFLAIPLSDRADAAPAAARDTITAVRYELSIDGRAVASFSDLIGITTSVPESQVAAEALVLEPQGPVKRVVLRRGLTRNIEMAAWHELVVLGDVEAARRSASLTAYAADGSPVARYHLSNAWPSKIEVGALKAGASEVLMETVTMTCEYIQRVSV